MIDMHCHLDLYPNARALLPTVARTNIFTFAVTTSPRAWKATSKVFASFENIHVGLGLHPEVAVQKASERDLLISSIKETRFIGEIGLDGSRHFKDSLPLQISILEEVLAECQIQGDKIISIHSRGAVKHTLDLLAKYPDIGQPILHWFSGTVSELYRAIDLGCWFSVGPAMLNNRKGNELLKLMPLNKILPESDGPFATIDNRPVMPWQASDIVFNISQLFNINMKESNFQIKNNLKNLINISL